jgi:hypothetical protein
MSEPETNRRKKVRLLGRQYRAKLAAMRQEFRAKEGAAMAPETNRREKARLLVQEFRAKVGAMLQEFRAKFGTNLPDAVTGGSCPPPRPNITAKEVSNEPDLRQADDIGLAPAVPRGTQVPAAGAGG